MNKKTYALSLTPPFCFSNSYILFSKKEKKDRRKKMLPNSSPCLLHSKFFLLLMLFVRVQYNTHIYTHFHHTHVFRKTYGTTVYKLILLLVFWQRDNNTQKKRKKKKNERRNLLQDPYNSKTTCHSLYIHTHIYMSIYVLAQTTKSIKTHFNVLPDNNNNNNNNITCNTTSVLCTLFSQILLH